jgi:hypothetical protein
MKKLMIVLVVMVILIPMVSVAQQTPDMSQHKYQYFISYAVHTQMNDGSLGSQGRVISATFGSMTVFYAKKLNTGQAIVELQKMIEQQYPNRQVVIIFIKELE